MKCFFCKCLGFKKPIGVDKALKHCNKALGALGQPPWTGIARRTLREKVLFCKKFFRQKTCVGDGGERERALDDVFGIRVTVRSCCEKRIETKLCKSRLNSPTIAKVFENKFGQVVDKLSDLILCLFGFVKATKFRDSSEYLQCVQNVLAKSCLPC